MAPPASAIYSWAVLGAGAPAQPFGRSAPSRLIALCGTVRCSLDPSPSSPSTPLGQRMALLFLSRSPPPMSHVPSSTPSPPSSVTAPSRAPPPLAARPSRIATQMRWGLDLLVSAIAALPPGSGAWRRDCSTFDDHPHLVRRRRLPPPVVSKKEQNSATKKWCRWS